MHPLIMRIIGLLFLLVAGSLHAHPGSGIAVARDGRVYFLDTGAGVFSVDGKGRLQRHEGSAFHWFAFDPGSRFQRTPFPKVPGAEMESAGPVIVSSDVPVVVGRDGRFYYPDISGGRIRLTGIDVTGARFVRATLPAIRSAGGMVRWVNGLAAGSDWAIYYTEDRAVRRVDERGRVTTVVENVSVPDCSAVPGVESHLGPYLRGLAVARDGSVYVAAAGCGAVLRVKDGRSTVVLRSSPPWSPTAVAVQGSDVYVLEYLHTPGDDRRLWVPRIRKISRSGQVTTLVSVTR